MSREFVQTLLIFVLALAISSAHAQDLYRYTDENGRVVLNNAIPAQYVSAGYEVLDGRTGKLIQRVDALVVETDGGSSTVYLSPEDKILLASYSTVAEIQAHLDRKTAGLRAEIANIQADLRILGLELEKDQVELTRLTEREREIPQELLDHIVELEHSNSGLAAALERREADLASTESEYKGKMTRFEVLLSSKHR